MDAAHLYRMLVFASVVEKGSLTRAAESLNISRSMVSQHLKRLENRCQYSLLHRTTRRIALTREGEAFYHYCAELLKLAKQAEASIIPANEQLQGSITLAVPESLGEQIIAPILKAYHQRYPQVHLSLLMQDRQLDLTEHEIDIAIQIGMSKGAETRTTKLTQYHERLVANPAYIARHGAPLHPDNLAHHNWILLANNQLPRHCQFENSDGDSFKLQLTPLINCNSLQGTLSLACQGLGLALLPDPVIKPYLASGDLVQLLPDYHSRCAELYLTHPYAEMVPPRVMAMISLLSERLTTVEEL